MQTNRARSKRSVTANVRRQQIVEATVAVLSQVGSANASFARVAKQAGLSSPGFISYHFDSKDELLVAVLEYVMELRMANLHAATQGLTSATEALRATLESDLRYMGNRPELFAAIVESFHALRDQNGRLKYLGEARGEALVQLTSVLERGKKTGEFGNFDTANLALIIDGARTQFLAQQLRRKDFDVPKFTRALVAFALRAVAKKDPP